MLDAVKLLLIALSPSEIEATASHVFLGRLDGQKEILWQVYARRHETLSGVFAAQRSAFVQLAVGYLASRGLCDESRLTPAPAASGERP
jgi:hypothetical protein